MNATSQRLLELGLQHRRAGRAAEAEASFRRAIAIDPRNGAAWSHLGALAYESGQVALAAEHLQQAAELDPRDAQRLSDLGLVLTVAGRLDEAEQALMRALQLNPGDADTWAKRGNVRKSRGDRAGAESDYRRALVINPHLALALTNLGATLIEGREFALAAALLRQSLLLAPGANDALNNLGLALQAMGEDDEAERCLRQVAEQAPSSVGAWLTLAMHVLRGKRFDEALQLCQHAAVLAPTSARVFGCLGTVRWQMRQWPAAAEAFETALRLAPDHFEARTGLALVWRDEGRLDAALEQARRAIALAPASAGAHDILGTVHYRMNAHIDALASFERALALDPGLPMAHFHRALSWLLNGRYADGWREFEWRWRLPEVKLPIAPAPRWNGEPLDERTILLSSEQGFGDTLHFIRYASDLKHRGARVVLECEAALTGLLSRSSGLDQVVARGESLPAVDFCCPLLSLPGPLGATPGQPPATLPYLSAEPARVSRWQQALAARPGFKVGLAWQGDRKHAWDHFRSIELARLAPLATIDGVDLISLQRGFGEEQVAQAGFAVHVPSPPLDDGPASFNDTAALMPSLQLVICVDTAIAHLAGALGVPTWLLLNASPDWRWGLDGPTTGWYPTMRLFRQAQLGDWGPAIDELAAQLRAWVAASRAESPR